MGKSGWRGRAGRGVDRRRASTVARWRRHTTGQERGEAKNGQRDEPASSPPTAHEPGLELMIDCNWLLAVSAAWHSEPTAVTLDASVGSV